MIFEKFSIEIKNFWDLYLKYVSNNLDKVISYGQDDIQLDLKAYYPSHLLVTKMPSHFSFELFGVKKDCRPLKIVKRRCSDPNLYFDMFPADGDEGIPIFYMQQDSSLKSMALLHEKVSDSSSARFPILNSFESGLRRVGGAGPLVGLSDVTDKVFFHNVVFADARERAIRCKFVLLYGIFKKSWKIKDLVSYLEAEVNKVQEDGNLPAWGVTTASAETKNLYIMAHLQSLFLSEGIHETTIGDFIQKHSELITRAFGANSFVYEPYLEWKESVQGCTDTAINPDMLIERSDGYYDIVDLKLAGLKYKKLTKGERRRRRFNDYVQEGLAQLANYEEYFSLSRNADYAFERYGVRVKDPSLVLVVGSDENFRKDEVDEALRIHRGRKLVIIDYDTLARSLVG